MTHKEARARRLCNGCGKPDADLCRLKDGRHVSVCSQCWSGNWGAYVSTMRPVDVPWNEFCRPDGSLLGNP